MFVPAACSNGSPADADADAGASESIRFEAEVKVLDAVDAQAGPFPPTGPATVTLFAKGNGAMRVEASALATSAGLEPLPGTGRIALDASLELGGTLVVDTPLAEFEGPLPGLTELAIAANAEVEFDPFVLEGQDAVTVRAPISAAALPEIPLGTVPGHLELEVLESSALSVEFRGVCIELAERTAHYRGAAELSGSLELAGAIVLDLPPPVGRRIELPPMTVPLPKLDVPIAFEPVAVDSDGPWSAGDCDVPEVATESSGGPDPGSSGETSSSSDDTTTDGTSEDVGEGTTSETGTESDDGDVSSDFAMVTVDGVPWPSPTVHVEANPRTGTFELRIEGSTDPDPSAFGSTLMISAETPVDETCEPGQVLLAEQISATEHALFTQYAEGACGLRIESIPPDAPFRGSFSGELGGVSGTRRVEATFDARLDL